MKKKTWCPWLPVEYKKADVAAIQCVAAGTANEGQQVQAMKFIIENLGMTYDMTWFPGIEGVRDTDFANGRRFVGLQLVKLIKLKLGQLKDE